MSKRAGIIMAFAYYGGVFAYFLYDAKVYANIENYETFLYVYLYYVQKILLNVNLFIAILAYYMKIPVLNAQYRIRYGTNLTKIIFINMIKRSAYVGAATLVLFAIPSAFYQSAPGDYFILMKSVLLVFLYTFCWSAVEMVLYLKTGNLIIGLTTCAVLSFTMSIIHSNMVFNNMLPGSDDGYMTFFVAVLAVAGTVSAISIVRTTGRLECLA